MFMFKKNVCKTENLKHNAFVRNENIIILVYYTVIKILGINIGTSYRNTIIVFPRDAIRVVVCSEFASTILGHWDN